MPCSRQIKLDHNDELVCLEQREDVIAVGSQNHVMLIDPRDRKGSSRSIQTLEQNQSIRSLTLNEHLLTVGSGFGKISFYDLRAGSFTGWGEDSKTQMLEMGNGWLCPNSIFRSDPLFDCLDKCSSPRFAIHLSASHCAAVPVPPSPLTPLPPAYPPGITSS